MKRIAYVLVASLAFAAPVAADSLTLLLPSLTFPADEVITSTKGCTGTATQPICQLDE